MECLLQFKPYRRRLRQPLKMSRGTIEARDGVLLQFVNAGRPTALAEIVLLPYFGTETLEQSLSELRRISSSALNGELDSALQTIPEGCFATRYALQSGLAFASDPRLNTRKEITLSYLLPTGAAASESIHLAFALGYRTFKWKIGIAPVAEEQAVFRRICAELKHLSANEQAAKLRLDANGGLTLDTAREWIDACAESAVEFIEQPLRPEDVDGVFKLHELSPVPIALDESVATVSDLVRWSELGWGGLFVVKPSRLGDLNRFFHWREAAKRKIVYSSALETSVGMEIALRVAASDSYNAFAGGFGVSHWFIDDGLNVHPDQATLVATAAGLHELQAVWNVLTDAPSALS